VQVGLIKSQIITDSNNTNISIWILYREIPRNLSFFFLALQTVQVGLFKSNY
jgi:hypothetical protein